MSTRSPREPGNLAGAIYGQIVVTSTLAVLGHDATLSGLTIALSLVATMLVLWAAHVYSELLADRVRAGRALRADEIAAAAGHDWPLVQAVAPALVALLAAGLGVWSTDTAVNVGLGLGVASLFGWGLVIGRRSAFGWGRTVVVAMISSALGVAILALELLVH